MAQAAGHKFGQAIGEYCEAAIEPLLQDFADKHGLFLDKKGIRPGRKGKKLRWLDKYGSSHDLDYVLERGATSTKIGRPVAFIESAWRRYTKHSKNKAQEIQGAILPISEKHEFSAPFLGCILAGEYTANSLEQLRRVGFHILYFQYDTMIEAYKRVGVDAAYGEETSEDDLNKKLQYWQNVPDDKRPLVWERLLELNLSAVEEFMIELEGSVKRQVESIRVIPLHGRSIAFHAIDEAIHFVVAYNEGETHGPIVKYEVQIRYNNGDKIDAQFHDKGTTVDFLKAYRTGNWTPAEDELSEAVEPTEPEEHPED